MGDTIRNAYDKLAKFYEKNLEDRSPFNADYERPAMLSILQDMVKNKKILDAGCAGGFYTDKLTEMGGKVTAIDFNDKMIEITKNRLKDKAEVLKVDLQDKLPFKENEFDIIVSSLTLHYLKDIKSTFNEFKRILKPSGTFLFSVHHPFMDSSRFKDRSYFDRYLIKDTWKKEGIEIRLEFYHRSLQEIVNETSKFFVLESLIEPRPIESFKEKDKNNYEYLMNNPHFLIIKALNNRRTTSFLEYKKRNEEDILNILDIRD